MDSLSQELEPWLCEAQERSLHRRAGSEAGFSKVLVGLSTNTQTLSTDVAQDNAGSVRGRRTLLADAAESSRGEVSKGPWGLCSEPLPTAAFSSLSLTGRVTVVRWCCCSRAAPVPMEGQGCRKGCDVPFSVPAPELEFGQKWNAGQTRSPPSDTGTAPTPTAVWLDWRPGLLQG